MPGAILGLSAYSHDSACCILRDGQLLAAAEEERFSRVKHDSALPVRALRACLREARLSLADIAHVAFFENPENRPAAAAARKTCDDIAFAVREQLGLNLPIRFYEHHLSHAAAAFYYSGARDGAFFTADALGESTTALFGEIGSSGIRTFERVLHPHSLGVFYSAVTWFLGFEPNHDEYKVMGLAPYGRPAYADKLKMLLADGPGAQFRLNAEYFDFQNGPEVFGRLWAPLLGFGPRARGEAIKPHHHDLASSAQRLLEELIVGKAAYLKSRSRSRQLCLSGGVFLNCVANARVRAARLFDSVHVAPAAHDGGGAIGAAVLAHFDLFGAWPVSTGTPRARLGPSYDNEAVRELLESAGVPYEDFSRDTGALLEKTARALAAGQIVGWHQGAMELGARALGGRSILADPRPASMKDKINALVKKREAFRPFAPVTLEDEVPGYFEAEGAYPHMTETVQVRPGAGLEAVTHVDGSARLQTVTPASEPRLADLLGRFENLTGVPVLLNTSFNVAGEPIVENPEQALFGFIKAGLDVLVIGDFLVERSALPPDLVRQIEPLETPGRLTKPSQTVYAIL
ncbi:MAG TPA: carbamoyltransferase C-terminal domain-containing protein [Bdellovibrionales bacterium]|nr:carbamoyltransferase C-terminal domain-containing protein [Bdellovibrionales bacterium]